MVLLAAALTTKSGDALVSRQFVEMTRSRIEGLVAAFPKLVGVGQQHTFVETDSVRYVYQPMEALYLVLITTKNSNILEDLQTMHLFAKVVAEYCRALNEEDVKNNVFDIIFAFDEIVALGYRESVSLAQIRTFTEMDSHEEKIHQMLQKNKEREAREEAKRKMKELENQRREMQRAGGGSGRGFGRDASMGGGSGYGGISGGYGSGSASAGGNEEPAMSYSKPSSYNATPSSSSVASKGMRLGSKSKQQDSVDLLLIESGVNPRSASSESTATTGRSALPSAIAAESDVSMEDIHVRIEEKVSMTALRDGGLQNLEVKGDLMLLVQSADSARIKLHLDLQQQGLFQYKTHPNVDKKLFTGESIVALKDPSRPFPINSPLGVVKWRFQTTDESHIPLTISCWPSVGGDGTADVNIEYELEQKSLVLTRVNIAVPFSGGGQPVVGNCDGNYHIDTRQSLLLWEIPIIDKDNSTGSMEFSVNGVSNDTAFFPVQVNFSSNTTFCPLKVLGISNIASGGPINYSEEAILEPSDYKVI